MLGTEKRGLRKLKMTLRSFRLQVHQVKKTKRKLSKIDKSKRRKNRSKQSRGGRETEQRALEKNTCFVVGVRRCGLRRCGRREARCERQNTVTLSVGESKRRRWLPRRLSVGEVNLSLRFFLLMRRG